MAYGDDEGPWERVTRDFGAAFTSNPDDLRVTNRVGDPPDWSRQGFRCVRNVSRSTP